LKEFDIDGFITYLPDTLNLERYRTLNRPVEWIPDSTSKPNMEWISKVWICFTSVVCKQHMERDREPSDERKQEMNSETILNLLHPALYNIFSKPIGLFLFTTKCSKILSHPKYMSSSIIGKFKLSNANFIVPENVDIWMIHCALHVGTRICLEIMDFFSDHLNSENVANCSDEDVFKKLKGIPLHVSVTGDHMDIPSNQSVLVMDD
jgi:hypothetical protein